MSKFAASASELAALIRAKEIAPTELVRAALDRIDAIDPALNAFVYLDAEAALTRAAAQEQALLRGEALGPLGGVPVAMKDLFDSKAGWPTTFGGLPALRGNIATADSIWVERMEAAGAIIVGKTNAAPLGFRGTGDNPLFGPTRNPFDRAYNSGGSSGGSAAAVAAGLVPIAQATDGGGSTRIPAAFCGLVGLKPTFGRIPMLVSPNAFGGTSPFLFDGAVTRTVADSLLALEILEGFDPRDPYAALEPLAVRPHVTGRVDGVRIAYSANLDSYPVEPEITGAIERALQQFEAAGAIVEPVRLGFAEDHVAIAELWCRTIVHAQIATLDALAEAGVDILKDYPDTLTERHRSWIEAALGATTRERQRDERLRSMVYERVQAVLNRYDLLVTPTTACVGIRNGDGVDTIGPSEIEGVAVEPLIGWALTSYFNFTGHPAASVPVGLSNRGLPIGMQIAGNRFHDGAVLNACRFVEQAIGWAEIYERAGSSLSQGGA